MIIVKIWGGIGNQLFQYVFGQYLHYRYQQEVCYDDNAFYSVEKTRNRELNALDAEIQYDNSCSFNRYRGVKNRFLRYLFQMVPSHHYIEENLYGDGTEIEMILSRIKYDELYFFSGYWQDIKYYKWLKENISEFCLKVKDFPNELKFLRKLIVKTENSVSLHIRRGDYFSPKNISIYGVCGVDYYEEALHMMKYKYPYAKVFVFTDDIDWVKENVSIDDELIIIPNYPVCQLAYIEMMSLCQHHIISNSSFSWWGAVLNPDENSYVLCPNRWLLTSNKTIALKEWIHI